jgi:hypothetical protein
VHSPALVVLVRGIRHALSFFYAEMTFLQHISFLFLTSSKDNVVWRRGGPRFHDVLAQLDV